MEHEEVPNSMPENMLLMATRDTPGTTPTVPDTNQATYNIERNTEIAS